LAKVFAEAKIPCSVTGTGSLFLSHFGGTDIKDATGVAMSDRKMLAMYHLALMADHGIFFLPTKMGAISHSHRESDVRLLLAATEEIVNSGLLTH
ncbi:MAG: aspartate aminotransferase family protein, partial [Nitrososphaera sp.]